jgi:hypothetical protein
LPGDADCADQQERWATLLPFTALLVRLSPDLKMKLAEMAKRERRSLSKQVEFLLERSLSEPKQVEAEAGRSFNASTAKPKSKLGK